jgi:Peptidase family M28
MIRELGRAAVLGLLASTACGPANAPKAASVVRAEPPVTPAAGRNELRPASDHERQLEAELKKDVTELSQKIGERNVDKKWELASAADYLAGALEDMGYSVRRQGYEIDGVAAQNLEVELRGGKSPDEIVVVGAHYDSAPGSPGADDNASGVAGVLCLARSFKTSTPERTLRFVLFALEEPPYFQTPNMTSLRYARASAERGEQVVAMLSIESIGYFSDAAGSQKYPAPLSARYPTTASFVAVVGNEASKDLVTEVSEALRNRSSIPAEGAALPEDLPGVGWSDHWSFWQTRVPAVMVTDTAPFRYADYHKPTDTLDKLDFGRMSRVVAGIETALAEIVGDMLTPLPNRKFQDLPKL